MYRIANELLQPYTLLFLISIAALAGLWRRRRETRTRLLLLSVPLGMLLLSTPAVSYLAFGTLEWRFSPLTALPADNQALVVLAGGLLPKDEYQPASLLAENTLYRCLHAAELYRGSGPCLVVVSGGAVEVDREPHAVSLLMKEFLVEQGVAASDILIEDRSRSTYENASQCQEAARTPASEADHAGDGCRHMRRAAGCFERAGSMRPRSVRLSSRTFRIPAFDVSAESGAARHARSLSRVDGACLVLAARPHLKRMSKKPRLLVLLSALACCGGQLSRRGRGTDRAGESGPHPCHVRTPAAFRRQSRNHAGIRRGPLLSWLKSMAVEFAARDGGRRFRLEAGAIYFFHDFGGGGGLELDRISLHKTLEPFIAEDRKASLPEPSPEPATTEQRVLKLSVKVLVDEEEARGAPEMGGAAPQARGGGFVDFRTKLQVRFEVVAVGTWQSDDRITDFEASLGEFEKKVDPRPAELAIGFTSQYQLPAGRDPSRRHSRALRPHILLREWSQHVSETERLELLVHELATIGRRA